MHTNVFRFPTVSTDHIKMKLKKNSLYQTWALVETLGHWLALSPSSNKVTSSIPGQRALCVCVTSFLFTPPSPNDSWEKP